MDKSISYLESKPFLCVELSECYWNHFRHFFFLDYLPLIAAETVHIAQYQAKSLLKALDFVRNDTNYKYCTGILSGNEPKAIFCPENVVICEKKPWLLRGMHKH